MADLVVTKQELIDAQKDAQALDDIVNKGPEVHVKTRLGRYVWTLATLEQRSLLQINEWQNAITLITANDGVPALAVSDASGKTQQDINDNLEVFIFPQNYGGKFDGVTDIAPALRAAALDAKVKNATMVLTGKAFIGSTVDIDCNIDGRGAEIITPANSTFDVFTVNGGKDLTIGGFKLVKMGSSTKRGFGIRVTGESENIHIHDVFATGYNNAVVATNPFDSAINAKFKFSVSNTATGGSWKIGFTDIITMGQVKWTSNIPHTATAAALQTALDAALGVNNTRVTKDGTYYTIEMIGAFAGCFIPPPYLSYALLGAVMNGGAIDILQFGGMKFIKNLSLTNVTSEGAGEYGLSFACVDGLTIDHCKATHSWFDGIKFTKHVRNVEILGGYYCFNGESFFTIGSNQSAGDGIDLYAGGENVRILGGTYNFNRGTGIQIKNDDATDLSGYTSGRFGMCRKIDIIGVEASYNSAIGGIAITANKGLNDSWLVQDLNIIGGRQEGNAVYGITVNGATHVNISDVFANRNGSSGINVRANSSNVTLNNCTAIANGSTVGSGVGLIIEGKVVRVNGGNYIGCNSDSITADTDLSTLDKVHLNNIRVNETAEDVVINMPYEAYNSSGRGILVNGTPTGVIIHQKPTETLTANSSVIYGDVGSTFINKSGVKFAKLSGTVSTGVWRSGDLKQVTSITTDTTVTGGAEQYTIRAASADTVVTLPAASTVLGLELKFILLTNTAFKGKINRNGPDTINGGTTNIEMVSYGSTCTLLAIPAGWLLTAKSGTVTP